MNWDKASFTSLVIAGVLALAVVCALAYGGYWWLAKDTTNKRYDVNTNNQQYQSSLIQQNRDRVSDIDRALDPGQKAALTQQFCAINATITNPPADLVSAGARLC